MRISIYATNVLYHIHKEPFNMTIQIDSSLYLSINIYMNAHINMHNTNLNHIPTKTFYIVYLYIHIYIPISIY
jgi:hypothetical protein